MAAGVVRFYNRGLSTVAKADTPFGYVLANPGSTFDLYVGENSTELIPVKGTVTFVHGATRERYDVSAGNPSILADRSQVATGEGIVDPDWDAWNAGRDRFWTAKAKERGLSFRYLPPALRGDAYVLEENGRWERVVYEGRECSVLEAYKGRLRLAPFTAGRWTEWAW